MNKQAPFNEKQHEYLQRCLHSWFNVAEGGKRGGKNVLQTMAFCICLENHQNRIHLISGVSTATARLNILDCDGFGLANYFEGRCRTGQYQNRDCLYVQTRTGEKVVLVSGGGKNGDEKLIKGNTYGMAYVTEANECSPLFIKEVFDRTLSSKQRKVFHDLNPKAEGHWYYEDVLNWHEEQQAGNPDYGYNYGHFTIADNMSVSDEELKERIATYDKRSVWYLRDIRGKRKQAEGLVYPMFSVDSHVILDKQMPHNRRTARQIAKRVPAYEKFYISCDYGTKNPCAFILWGVSAGVYYAIDEYYYDGRKLTPRTDDEHYAALKELAGGRQIKGVIVDPSAASFITLIIRKKEFHPIEANNAVIDGIRETGNALKNGLLKFSSRCKSTIKEFGLYLWNDKKTEDEVIKDHDHCLSGDTVINTPNGNFRIEELVGKSGEVYCYDEKKHQLAVSIFSDVRLTRHNAEIFKVELENGTTIKATAEHPFLTTDGWKMLKRLDVNDKIICIGK